MHAAILDREPNYLSLEETRDHIKTVLCYISQPKQENPSHWTASGGNNLGYQR